MEEKKSLPNYVTIKKVHIMMNATSKRAYLINMKSRYQVSRKYVKTIILDEFDPVYDYDRKYAIRLLYPKRIILLLQANINQDDCLNTIIRRYRRS